jgi:hypothetical protein
LDLKKLFNYSGLSRIILSISIVLESPVKGRWGVEAGSMEKAIQLMISFAYCD